MSLPKGATDAVRVGGGDINEGWRVRMADGTPAFVKTRSDAAPGEYEREAAGLSWLAEPGYLRVPKVLAVGEDHLALQWVERGRLSSEGAEELGRSLALTHAAGAPSFGDPRFGGTSATSGAAAASATSGAGAASATSGIASASAMSGAAEPATIGSLSLPNEPADHWPSFYAGSRLMPALRAARDRRSISRSGAEAVQRVCERIDELAGPAEPPARLHGDLWSGNVLADADGNAWLIDPTAYGGHREVDLAMLRLFGAPAERIFDAYEDACPLADGWRERISLWQLLPLLVHAALFGGSYGGQAERVALRYAG